MNNTLKYYRSKRDRLQLRYGNRLYNQRERKKKRVRFEKLLFDVPRDESGK